MNINAVDGNPRFLDVENVLYIQAIGNNITIRTEQKKYNQLSTVRDYSKLLLPFGFEFVSKSTIVQVDKIILFDEKERIAYFDKDRKIEGVKVSRRNLNKVL